MTASRRGGAGAGRHVLSTPLQRTVMQNIFFWSSKKKFNAHYPSTHGGLVAFFHLLSLALCMWVDR